MRSSNSKVERIGFGLILGFGLLMFFQPLVRLHGPNGSQVSNAFDLRAGLTRLQSNLSVMATIIYSTEGNASLVSTAVAPAATKSITMPFSLRTASFAQWLVYAAMGFCLLALLDNFILRKAFGIFSLLGACAGAGAVLHVMLMGSDLQSWTEVLTNTTLINTPNDPSGAIMMANSFLVSPGFGLYTLTACMFLVPSLSYTHAVPRVRRVLRRERRVSTSQPISIRPVNSRYSEEKCTSLDMSKGGLLLESSLNHYYVGMEVYLTRSAGPEAPASAEEHGSVVWVEKMQKGGCRVGIRIIPEV